MSLHVSISQLHYSPELQKYKKKNPQQHKNPSELSNYPEAATLTPNLHLSPKPESERPCWDLLSPTTQEEVRIRSRGSKTTSFYSPATG